jgi:ankyrin repeat protein
VKKVYTKEDFYKNLQFIVLKERKGTNEDMHRLVEFAVSMNDLDTLNSLANDFSLLEAKRYLRQFEEESNSSDILEFVSFSNDYEALEALIDKGTYINKPDRFGETALIKACIGNKVDFVKLLLLKGADAHVKLHSGTRLIEHQLDAGHSEIVDLLISHGADNILEEKGGQFFRDIEKSITSAFIAKQFVCEELDAARKANKEGKQFAANSGIDEADYIGAMERSVPEVDGPDGPQQLLSRQCFSIMNNNNRDIVAHIRRLTVQKVMSRYRIGKYADTVKVLTLENGEAVSVFKDYAVVDSEKFEKITDSKFLNVGRKVYLEIEYDAATFYQQTYSEKPKLAEYFYITSEQEILKRSNRHDPKRLIDILTCFTKDNPVKYTTHSFDWSSYGTYENFMLKVSEAFKVIAYDFEYLSPNLYDKTFKFLFAENLNQTNTWGMSRVSFGWSSPEIKLHALTGEKEKHQEKAIYYQLPEAHVKKVNGRYLRTFNDVCNIFKNEIEFRDDENLLQLLTEIDEKVFDFEFVVDYINLESISFYTDVEYFGRAVEKIFELFKHYGKDKYKHVVIEAVKSVDGEYFDLLITHTGSCTTKGREKMMQETDDGDFHDIRELLQSLCDWSILACFQNDSYKINYLSIESEQVTVSDLQQIPEGFTHQLRFYYG